MAIYFMDDIIHGDIFQGDIIHGDIFHGDIFMAIYFMAMWRSIDLKCSNNSSMLANKVSYFTVWYRVKRIRCVLGSKTHSLLTRMHDG